MSDQRHDGIWRDEAAPGSADRPTSSNDSPAKAVLVTFVVCLCASIVVTTSAVLLRPLQMANRQNEQYRQIDQILQGVKGGNDAVLGANLKGLEARVVDLESGDYVEGSDPAKFDQRTLARDPVQSVVIPPAKDLAGIKTRARRAVVHLLQKNGRHELVVLPIYGRGFGSTLYGYIGLSGDTRTVVGIAFYEHGETPGLGALIDDPAWRRLWSGKMVWGDAGEVALGWPGDR